MINNQISLVQVFFQLAAGFRIFVNVHMPVPAAYHARGLLMVQHRDEATAHAGRQYLKSVEFLDSRVTVLRGLEDSRHEHILYVSFQRVRNQIA